MSDQASSSGLFLPFEKQARTAGHHWVVGIDEAGRGPLAGPVVAASVLFPEEVSIDGLRDSKGLTARQRDRLYDQIHQYVLTYGIGIVNADQIDKYNILWATKKAMRLSVEQLDRKPDMLLIDGTETLPVQIPQQAIVRGDAICASIAAASVLAKVTRDKLMIDYAKQYPEYGFERHKGYPTEEHYARLRSHGPCPIHRYSFRGVAQAPHQSRIREA